MRFGSLILILAAALYGQQRAAFDVASIRPSPPVGAQTQPGCRGGPGTDDPAQMVCEQMSVALLIMIAYDVKYPQLAGPDWMSGERFDLNATAPAGSTKQQVPEMWQSLLAERFHLAVHHESRETTRYELTVAKGGPKMKPAPQDPAAVRPGGMAAFGNGARRMTFPRVTMSSLASMLGNQLHAVVSDNTGLSGAYEIHLEWTDGLQASTGPDAPPPMAQALNDQLGLRLEAKKGPVDMLVVDHVDRTPTGN